MLKGYLSYTMAWAAVLTGILGLVFSWFNVVEALALIWAGLSLYGVRRNQNLGNTG